MLKIPFRNRLSVKKILFASVWVKTTLLKNSLGKCFCGWKLLHGKSSVCKKICQRAARLKSLSVQRLLCVRSSLCNFVWRKHVLWFSNPLRGQRRGSQELTGSGSKNKFSRGVRGTGCQYGSHKYVPTHGFQVAHVPRNSFPRKILQSEISKHICKQGWKQKQNPKQSSEGQIPKQGSQGKIGKFLSRARSRWTFLKEADTISKNGFPKESSQWPVTRQCSQARGSFWVEGRQSFKLQGSTCLKAYPAQIWSSSLALSLGTTPQGCFEAAWQRSFGGGNGGWPSTGRKKLERWAFVWARKVDVDPWTFVIPDLAYSEKPSTSPATGVRHHLCIRLSVKAYVVEKRLRMKEVYVKKISLLSARTFCL